MHVARREGVPNAVETIPNSLLEPFGHTEGPRFERTETRRVSSIAPATATLHISVGFAYDLFCDASNTSRWLPQVSAVRIISNDDLGRPRDASFLLNVNRATVGFNLKYEYNANDFEVIWKTHENSHVEFTGQASFRSLSPKLTLMTFSLHCYSSALVGNEKIFDGHPASVVMQYFRDFISKYWN